MGRGGIAGIASRLRYGGPEFESGGVSNLQNTKDKALGISWI